MRAVVDCAQAVSLRVIEWKVLTAVLALTTSYSRLKDETSTRQLAAIVYAVDSDDVTGWQRGKVSKSLQRLGVLGVISYEPGRGRASRCIVRLPERGSLGPPLGELNVARSDAKRGRNRAENVATREGHSEKYPSNSPRGEHSPPTRERDSFRDTFTPADRESVPPKERNGEPDDALKRRCVDIFTPKNATRDDCVRAIDQLRADNIADELIDTARGQCEKKHDVRHVGYLLKVARDFYKQRTGVVV